MDIIYNSVFDNLNDTICNVLNEYGVKYERESVFSDASNMHETKLTIHCKNERQKTAVNYLIVAINQLAF